MLMFVMPMSECAWVYKAYYLKVTSSGYSYKVNIVK